MSRVAFPLVLQSLSGAAITGGTATITNHVVGSTPGSGSATTIYTSETGGGTVAGDQITTDTTGRWTQGSPGFSQYWLAEGTYDIAISGTGLTSYVVTREFISAITHLSGGGAMDFSEGVIASQPAASSVPAGYRYYATDTQALAFSTASAWVGVALTSAPTTFTAAVTAAALLTAQAGITLDAGSGTMGQTVTLTGRNAGTATSGSLAVSSTGAVTLTSGTGTLTGATSGGTAFTATTTAFNIPSGAVYEVSGTQIAASNLSNGTSGSGAVALVASPTFTGTVAVAAISASGAYTQTGSGANTFSGATTFSASGTAVTITNTLSVGTVAATTLSGTPNFSGAATGQTATAGDNSTKLATTAFVATSFAPLASPTFTGTPAAPTASVGTNTTQLATTAFVLANASSGKYGRVTSDITGVGSMTNITGWSFSIGAGEVWSFYGLLWVHRTNLQGGHLQLTGPASPTSVRLTYTGSDTGSAGQADPTTPVTAFSSSTSLLANVNGGGDLSIWVVGTIVNGANAGTVQLQGDAGSEGTYKAGSFVIATKGS